MVKRMRGVYCFSLAVKLVTTPTFFWRKSPPLRPEGNKRGNFDKLKDLQTRGGSWGGV